MLKGGLHVLYIEGTLRSEEKWLRMSLDSSPGTSSSTPTRINPRHKETRPGDFAELLKPGKSNVYILGDLDRDAFEPGELKPARPETV